ncbi:hypothetical protein GG496_000468 [Candidatus Fervidibacteria bacterium JGI MDM2 JNZ-1-D12]
MERATRHQSWTVGLLTVLLVVVFIALNALWDAYGLMTGQMRPSTVSLFVNVVATIFAVALVNELTRILFRRSLSPSSLLWLYVSLSVASAVFGLDLLQPLLSVIAHPIWFAGQGNDWDVTILPHLPRLLVVWDKDALRGFYTGLATFERWDVVQGWLPALLWWGSFLFLLGLGMLCLCGLFLRDWTEKARLSYPIAQIPLELMTPNLPLLRQKVFWAGFCLAAFMNLLNGLHFLYPNIPSMGGWLFDLSPFFPNRPLNAIGWTPITLLPFGVGLGFLMPLDLTLSCWVFYLVWKIERVLAAMTGWWGLPRFPYAEEQQFGAYACWALLALMPKLKGSVQACKRAGVQAYKRAGVQEFKRVKDKGAIANLKVAVATDVETQTSFRSETVWALGFVACFVGLTILCVQQGMSWWLAMLFFAGYFLIAIGIARIRAQLGSPVHDLHFSGPDRMLLFVSGSRNLSMRDLCFLTIFGGFNRAYRGHPMPHILEGMWLEKQLRDMQHRTRGTDKVEMRVAMKASVVGWLLGYGFGAWALLRASFQFGGRPWYGMEVFRQLDTYRYSPTGFGWASLFAILWGLTQTFLLSTLHNHFNFPLHPAGFVVSGSWSMNLFWVSLFVAWLLKASLIRWGGLAMHRQATPFFMGLVLGDYLMGSFWSLWGCWQKKPAYNFLP